MKVQNTSDADALGTLRLLENRNYLPKSKFYQASTSEIYGNNANIPQDENTPLIQQVPTVFQNYMHFTCVKIIEKLTTCTVVMVFCLIMKAQEEVKLLLLEKYQDM